MAEQKEDKSLAMGRVWSEESLKEFSDLPGCRPYPALVEELFLGVGFADPPPDLPGQHVQETI